MKAKLLLIGMLVTAAAGLPAATNDLSRALQNGLFEEEANHNLGAAIQAYQSVVSQLDEARNLSATAVFRLGECYRKQGKTHDAIAQYQRVLRDFSDQPELLTPARDSLAALGSASAQAVPSPLADSTETDQVKHIQEMIRNSPDLINAKDNQSGFAPLHTAAAQGQIVVARFLLANGADIEAKIGPRSGYHGMTPLQIATINGHKAMVDFLLSQKADVRAADNNGATALHLAASRGFRSVIEVLLDHRAEINATDRTGETPLHYAAASGNRAIIELLIAHQAGVNAKNQKGATPLINAITEKQLTAARVLVANKANLNFSCQNKYHSGYPVHFAVLSEDDEILELLLKNGADPDMKVIAGAEDAGDTPLHLAVKMGRKSAARLLLDYKADPNLKNGQQDTPLILAVKKGSKEIAELLLAHGANPSEQDQAGRSPLYLAVEPGRKDLVEPLLAGKADVNAPDRHGFTPLHVAVGRQNRDQVELLLANGADANVRSNEGKTALDYATQRSGPLTEQITQLLRQHGAVDEFPDPSSIRITRNGIAPTIIFRKDTNSLNRFTLLEAIRNYFVYDIANRNDRTKAPFPGRALPFPDFSNIKIHRGSDPKSSGTKAISANLLTATNTLDCAKDVWLEFGDVIEVPERDHTLAEPAIGLTEIQSEELSKCLQRKVTFVVRGQPTQIHLYGLNGANDLSSILKLDEVKRILRSSSDLSRLTLKRTDPDTKKSLKLSVEPKQGPDDLWLRDGDVVEVPDKK